MIAPPTSPRPDELELLIKEARARQRLRRLLAVAGVAIAAGLGLGIYALAGGLGKSPTKHGATGWGGVPFCRSPQLTTMPIGFLGWGAISGDVGNAGGLEITNVGGASCSLAAGTLRVGAYLLGKRLPVTQLPANRSVPNSRGGRIVHVLAPGGRAFVVFVWRSWCGPSNPNARATLRYVFGSGLVLSQDVATPACAAPGSPSTLRAAGPFAN